MTKDAGVEFVDELPGPPRRYGRPHAAYLDELRQNPGQWAVITRYPQQKKGGARSRGWKITKHHSDIEYAVRVVGDEAILYLRAIENSHDR